MPAKCFSGFDYKEKIVYHCLLVLSTCTHPVNQIMAHEALHLSLCICLYAAHEGLHVPLLRCLCCT